MDIEPLSAARRTDMGFKEQGGVLISNVEGSSFASDIGLAEGDVLMSINRQPVNSVADVQRVRAGLKPGDSVMFNVLRQVGRGRQAEWRSFFPSGQLPLK